MADQPPDTGGGDARLDDVYDYAEMKVMFEQAQALHVQVLEQLARLKDRMSEIQVSDKELGYHHLWLDTVHKMATEIKSKTDDVLFFSARRFFLTLLPRGADGLMVFGRQFNLDGELIPSMPSKNTKPKEYQEMIAWVAKSQYKSRIRVDVPWQSMKTIVAELSKEGLPPPPHVKLTPKPKVKIKK